MFKESSIVLYFKDGANAPQVVDFQKGTPGSVEFNFFRIWDLIKNKGVKPHQLYYYHVHPMGYLQASEVDKDCMIGWTKAFGTNVLNFNIITFKTLDLDQLSHEMVTYSCCKDTLKFSTLGGLNIKHHLPKSIASLLKLTSYGDDTCQ